MPSPDGTFEHNGTTCAHVDMADAVNVLVHVDGFSGSSSNSAAESGPNGEEEAALPTTEAEEKPIGELYGQPLLPSHGAVWYVFSQSDTRLLQAMLPYFVRQRKRARDRERSHTHLRSDAHKHLCSLCSHSQSIPPSPSSLSGGLKENRRELLESTNALFDAGFYLDDDLLDALRIQAGIVPYIILQKLGDAVLVPAGCAHQVRNLRSCIKVALDFVAPEHVSHCVRLTEELRQLPTWHHRRQDVLSIRTILFYAVCACFGAFEEHKKKEEAKKEKQRRENRKSKEQEAVASAPLSAKSPVLGLEAPPPQEQTNLLAQLPELYQEVDGEQSKESSAEC